MAAVHFEHGIITPITLAVTYAMAPHIKYNTQIAVGVYSLVYFYQSDSLLLLNLVEIVKGMVVINFVCQHKCYTIFNFLGMSALSFEWHYKYIFLLYTFGLGTRVYVASELGSAILFYVTIYLYQLLLYKI